MPQVMKTGIRVVQEMDGSGGGMSEKDAIKTTNQKKGFLGGKDNVPPEQEVEDEEPNPRPVKGSDSVEAPKPKPSPEPPSNDPDGTIALPRDQLNSIIQAGVERQMVSVQVQIDELNKRIADEKSEKERIQNEAAQERDRLQKKIEEERKNRDTLTRVFADFGYTAPGSEATPSTGTGFPTPIRSRDGFRGDDYCREYIRILDDRDSTPLGSWINPYSGECYVAKDTRNARAFLKKNRDQVRRGMELMFKSHGFLQGRTNHYGKDAPTTRADLPPAFLDYLSDMVRMNHSPKFILWQFANRRLELGRGPGEAIQVPRVAYSETGDAPADWELTPGIPIVADSQPMQAAAARIVLKEYGMGKDANLRPIGIPEFIMATSMIELETALNRNLGHNYNEFEDILLRSLWFATTRVVYNVSGSASVNPAGLVAGANGTMTYRFLLALYAYMCALQIPAYENGCYGLVLHSNALAQLKADLTDESFSDRQTMEEITNIFRSITSTDLERISGYEGMIGNFMIFTTNAFSLGLPGTVGAQTEGGVVTRTSFAFGADTVAVAEGMPMQIRRSNEDDFGRMNRYIWKAHIGAGYLDVDPALDNPPPVPLVPQQLRVVAIHTTDVEL